MGRDEEAMHDDALAIPLAARSDLDALRASTPELSPTEFVLAMDELNGATPQVFEGLADRRFNETGWQL